MQPLTFCYNYFRQKVGVNVLKQPLSLKMSLDKKIHSLSFNKSNTVQLSQQATIIICVKQLDSMLLSICSVTDPR